jgi:hypothetical protein
MDQNLYLNVDPETSCFMLPSYHLSILRTKLSTVPSPQPAAESKNRSCAHEHSLPMYLGSRRHRAASFAGYRPMPIDPCSCGHPLDELPISTNTEFTGRPHNQPAPCVDPPSSTQNQGFGLLQPVPMRHFRPFCSLQQSARKYFSDISIEGIKADRWIIWSCLPGGVSIEHRRLCLGFQSESQGLAPARIVALLTAEERSSMMTG